MAARRKTLDALLERERRSSSAADEAGQTRRLNSVWRQKVIHWYFTLVAALQRQQARSDGADVPFDRSTVHVTASLLDAYLLSVSSERALRYKHDRPAYQLLATTCLLLGLRLDKHDQVKEEAPASADEPSRGLKRAKPHMMDMSAVPATEDAPSEGAALPTASTLLRISAAPKSLTERHVASMVKEVTSSRSFPRSGVVTALDFIAALAGARTDVGQGSVTLGPQEVEAASRLADASLRDSSSVGLGPSAVAAAAVTLALARSQDASLAHLREQVHRSLFGLEINADLQASIQRAEANLLASIQARAPPSRNGVRRAVPLAVPTAHLIPLEDD